MATTTTHDPLAKKDLAPLSQPSWGLGIAASAVCGALFGFLLQRGHVFEPEHIVGQMLLRRWFMLKMFLAAAGTSVLALAAVARFHPRGNALVASARKWAFNGYRGPVASALGGLILGAGITLAGACPGTVLAQVGAGVHWATLTVCGCLIGALLFALLEPSVLQPSGILKLGMFKRPTFDLLLGKSFGVVAVAMAALFFTVVAVIEIAVPWRSEFTFDVGTLTPLGYAWPPWLAGVGVGLLQIPLLLFVGETLGASRAYVTIVGNALAVVAPKLANANKYLVGAMHGLANWSQVTFIITAMLGSFFAVLGSGSAFGAASGFSPFRSLIGGALIVFGGRMSGGCTSGQGITGNSVLALNSPIVTACMFVGGIITARLAM